MTGPTLRHVWRDVVRDHPDPLVDVYTVAVAMALDRFMSADGRTRTGLRRLAQIARCTTDTVANRIARLELLGLLEVSRPARGGFTRYQARCPTASDTGAVPGTDEQPEVSGQVGHSPVKRPARSDTWPGPEGDRLGNRRGTARVSDPTGASVRPHGRECPTPPVEVSDRVGPIPGGPVRDPTGSPGRVAAGPADAVPAGPAGNDAPSTGGKPSAGDSDRRPPSTDGGQGRTTHPSSGLPSPSTRTRRPTLGEVARQRRAAGDAAASTGNGGQGWLDP